MGEEKGISITDKTLYTEKEYLEKNIAKRRCYLCIHREYSFSHLTEWCNCVMRLD